MCSLFKYLSIVKDDLFGAESIYLKGLQHYPNRYWLIYHTAFNYYFEIKDRDKGLEYFKLLKAHPDSNKLSPHLSSLIATMVARKGELEAARLMLESALLNTTDPNLKRRYKYLLLSLKVDEDLTCLNQDLGNCSKRDPKGSLYFKENGLYRSKNVWKSFNHDTKKRVRNISDPQK